MRRDMDLIRELLLEIEEKHDGSGRQVDVSGGESPPPVVTEHLFMLAEAGLIEAQDASHMQGRRIIVQRMTWQGHEFLDRIRDPQIWAKTKEGARRVGSFSLDVLSDVARGIIRKKISDLSGIELDL